MKTMTTIALLAVLLLTPLTAHAQQALSYNDAVKVYNATNRIDREVWMGNPDEAAKVRHQLWLFHDAGIYPPNFPRPWDIDIRTEPEERQVGEDCFWRYNEDGTWEEVCNVWHTYRCNAQSQIDEIKSLANGAGWMAITWGAAAVTAGLFFRPDLAAWFGYHAIAMNVSERYLNQQVEKMEANKCGGL